MACWDEKKEVQKGDFGEDIVNKILRDKGFVIYEPQKIGPHAFDRLAIKNKDSIIIAETKTKARLNSVPKTGFDKRSYDCYKKISLKHGLPVMIFFVDEMLGKVYGNFLHKLEKNMEHRIFRESPMVLFNLSDMTFFYDLTKDQINYLKSKSCRSYAYQKEFQ
jgi:hypothetical protein